VRSGSIRKFNGGQMGRTARVRSRRASSRRSRARVTYMELQERCDWTSKLVTPWVTEEMKVPRGVAIRVLKTMDVDMWLYPDMRVVVAWSGGTPFELAREIERRGAEDLERERLLGGKPSGSGGRSSPPGNVGGRAATSLPELDVGETRGRAGVRKST